LDTSEFRTLLSDSSVAILDARDNKDAFHSAHIPRSISAPLHSPFFSNSAGSFLSEKEKFVLIVENMHDAELAARQLYRIGIDGMIGWFPLEEATSSGFLAAKTDVRDVASFNPQSIGAEGVIVDVRTTAEYQAGHLPNALSLPYTRISEHLAAIPKGKRLYVHCASGKRASLASSFLASHGFDVVYLDGNFASCLRNTCQG
jgi:hydroxyacylglutathione hydrolase